MITSIARQAVILKCLRRKSVLVGNYEFYYLAGLMKQRFALDLNEKMEPQELSDVILKALPELKTSDENEAYLLRMVSIFEPLPNRDAQMEELFRWGETEAHLWQVNL